MARRATAAHFRLDPTRIHGAGLHVTPPPRDGVREHDVVQLAVGVSLERLEPAIRPADVFEAVVATGVQARGEVEQAFGLVHQTGQDVGAERVDGKGRLQAICSLVVLVLGAEASVVDDGVEGPGFVGFGREILGAFDGEEVAYYYAFGFGDYFFRLLGAVCVAGVEVDIVALVC